MIPSVYGAPVGAPTSFRRVASASTANAKGGSAFRLPALSRSIRKTPAETGVTLTFPEPPTGPEPMAGKAPSAVRILTSVAVASNVA